LPNQITTSSTLSPTICAVSFNNDTELQNWHDDFFTAKPVDFFKCGIENLTEGWEAVVYNGEYIIDCLIICVKNKLFGSVRKPHELMHQHNISDAGYGNLRKNLTPNFYDMAK
jgi:hypothetical protein